MQKQDILLYYSWNGRAAAHALAEAANLAGLIGARGKHIALKPNLVVARPAEEGATTHPAVAEGLIAYLHAHGFFNITILEGAWLGDDTEAAFDACGYRRLAARTGVALHNTKNDKALQVNAAGLPLAVCGSVPGIDFLINLPVLKGHCQTKLTCALKNMKGLIPDPEKRRYHTMGLHKPIAHLNTAIQQHFIVVDGICGDLDFEEGGTPVPAGRLFAARDAVLCDAFAAGLLGYTPEEIAYIPLAAALGVGQMDVAAARVQELNRPPAPGQQKPGGKIQKYAQKIHEKSACSACYAAVVRALRQLPAAALNALPGPAVCVGQGWRGQAGHFGAGNCTGGFAHSVQGCPPSARDILEGLHNMLAENTENTE